MHPHVDCIGEFDPADPITSARAMIAAADTSSAFRGSPVIACLTAIVDQADTADALRDEMKAIALATGRSKTDGESDCDWAFLSEEVAEKIREASVVEREACMSLCINMLFDSEHSDYQHGHNQALLESVRKMRARAEAAR